MAGPRSPAQTGRNFLHVDERQRLAVSGRIHFIHRRGKQHINSRALGQFTIPGQIARIIGIILLRTELQRIDEQRGNHKTLFLSGSAHQGQMPFVQVAHRRNQTDGFPLPLRSVNDLLQLLNLLDNLHQQHLIIRSKKNNAFPQTGRRISSVSTCVPRLGHHGSKRCREYRIVLFGTFRAAHKGCRLIIASLW